MTTDLPSYPAMRDSGVPWLGDVPEHWDVRRIKAVFREKDKRSGDGSGLLLSLTRARGIVAQRDASTKIASAEDLSEYKVTAPGDMVMNRMQAWSGMFAVSPMEGLISPDYAVFERIGPSEVGYFEHLFKTPMMVAEFARGSKGIGSGFNRLYTPDFGAVSVVFPPLPEQAAITRFLDHADRRIQRYIRARQKLIGLLAEHKHAIIHRAVTRGLDPNVRLKPSGVQWLSDVPEHWDVARLKTRLIRNDAGAWGADASAEGTLVLRSTEQTVDGGWRIDNPARRRLSSAQRDATLLLAGDLVVTKSSGSALHIGKTSLVTDVIEGMECGFSNFMQRLRLGRGAVPHFVWHFINNRAGRDQLVYYSSTTTGLGNLTGAILGNLQVAFPPVDEQERICDRVEEDLTPAIAASVRAHSEVDLVREYRTRLITDAVTGKIDVREEAARLPDEVEERLDEADVADTQDAVADDLDVAEDQVDP